MKIGIDARFWGETGVGRYTRHLLLEFQKIDTKNSYVVYTISKNVSEVKKYLTNKNFEIRVANIKWHTLGEQLTFPTILKKDNCDLVHFPYFSVPILYNSPFVITIHDLILHHFPTGEASTLPLPLYKLKHSGYKAIIQKAASKAEKIIAVSNATKEEIITHLGIPSEKVIVIHEGVSMESPTFKNENLTSNILHVGNLYPHKNMRRVLDALEILTNKKIDLKLIIVGRKDFFYDKFYKEVKSRGLSDLVEFKGEVTDTELQNLYHNARATIVPSLMEGFGLPALEALANKCLVLSSNIPSLKEVCNDSAIYFEPLDSSDIAKKIEVAFNLPAKEMLAKKEIGYNRSQLFSWEKMGKETLKVYESCAGLRQDK